MSSPPGSAAQPAIIRTASLGVSFAGQQVIHDVSISIEPGEVVAIIGPNGSGKSTLIRAILGLVPRITGSVEVFGKKRLRGADRARIGYVPQRMFATAGIPMTVREVVESGTRAGVLRRTTPRAAEAVDAALETVGLADMRNRSVAVLSGGQQQRVLIARALVRNPDLIVLDEPMAGIDLAQQAAFAATLQQLINDGRTIILVLHEFGAIAPLLTRVIALDHGHVEYDNGPENAPEHCVVEHLPIAGAPDAHRHDLSGHDHVHPHEGPQHDRSPWVPRALPTDRGHAL